MGAPGLRILADENVPLKVIKALESLGVKVLTVGDLGIRGTGDEEVLGTAAGLRVPLLSLDVKDFSRLHVSWLNGRMAHFGIILVSTKSLRTLGPGGVAARVVEVLGWYRGQTGWVHYV